MITVNGWRIGGMVVRKGNGYMSVQIMGEMGKDFSPNFLHLFVKPLIEGAVTTEMWVILRICAT